MEEGRNFDPARPPRVTGPVVDYALAKRSLIGLVRRGLVPTTDACDAHPELLRAGKNIGAESPDPCPICGHDTLRLLRYVYGDQLGRDSGRVVYPPEWLGELVQRCPEFTCYVVEVCVDCHWNHLIRSYVTGAGEEVPRRRKQNRA
ncbi:MAG: DUF5318 family protein [Actinomycetota bacterium]